MNSVVDQIKAIHAAEDMLAQMTFDPKPTHRPQGVVPPPKESADAAGPEHYKKLKVEPWAVMEAILTHEEFVGFLKGNVIKYAIRQGRKLGAPDDAEKAQHYMQKLKEVSR